jgi:hypothetical protein|tara:strand:+ start:928 stop:1506 length:579 start_codon:yes stop_codon:yes gene_type:complete
VTIRVPETIFASDTVIFDVPAFVDSVGTQIDSASYTLTWYARTNTNHEGATITGVAESDGWRITVPSNVTTGFDAGLWTWQAIASLGAVQYTAGRGQFTVKATLSYTGQPGAFDDRSRAQIDYDYVNAAIRTLSQGGAVQEYTIGGRSLKRYKMTELLELRDSLKAEVDRERRAEKIKQGLGNPGVTRVRFI